MVGCGPDLCLITMSAPLGLQRMTREHLILTSALVVPILIVINKSDLVTAPVLAHLVDDIKSILHSAKKKSVVVETVDDVTDLCYRECGVIQTHSMSPQSAWKSNGSGDRSLSSPFSQSPLPSPTAVTEDIVPIFTVSCVTGKDIELLKLFLFHYNASSTQVQSSSEPATKRDVRSIDGTEGEGSK